MAAGASLAARCAEHQQQCKFALDLAYFRLKRLHSYAFATTCSKRHCRSEVIARFDIFESVKFDNNAPGSALFQWPAGTHVYAYQYWAFHCLGHGEHQQGLSKQLNALFRNHPTIDSNATQ